MTLEDILKNDYVPLDLKVSSLLVRESHKIETAQKKVLKKYDLSQTQLGVLHILDMHSDKKVTVKFIKEKLLDESPNASRSMKPLFERSLIEKKQSDSDKRSKEIKITKKGIEIHRSADQEILKMRNLNKLSEKELQNLYKILLKMSIDNNID